MMMIVMMMTMIAMMIMKCRNGCWVGAAAWSTIRLVYSWSLGLLLFTALHTLRATQSSHEKAVCQSLRVSVRPSVCQRGDLWQNRGNFCPDFYTIWKIIYPSFLRRMVGGGGQLRLPEILGQTDPVAANWPIISRYSLLSLQP